MLRVPVLSPANSSSILHADYSSLRAFQAVVDTASESSASALSSAVSTSIWELRNDQWVACKSELKSAELSTGPLTKYASPGTKALG